MLPLTAFGRRPELLKEVIAHTLEEEVLSFTGDKAKLDFAFEAGADSRAANWYYPVSWLWNPSELSRYVRKSWNLPHAPGAEVRKNSVGPSLLSLEDLNCS
jgi:hypothetical protein